MSNPLSNMLGYFQSLLASFKKSDIYTEVASNLETTLGTIKQMYAVNPMPSFMSRTDDKCKALWRRQIHTYSDSPFATIVKTLHTVESNNSAILEMINTEFADTNPKAVMDYYKLNIIKYLEGIDFFNAYSDKWLTAVMYETVMSKEHLDIDDPTMRECLEFVNNNDNMASFITIVNVLGMPLANFMASIQNLKGHIVTPEEWSTVVHSVTGNKLDPHKLGFLPVKANLFYHVMLANNVRRVKKHERSKETLARLQLMVSALQERLTATEDPNRKANIEKQINYHSNRINAISARIESLEDEWRHA